MEAKAILRTARISPQKARLVADQVRGLPAERAVNLLKFSDKKAAALIKKVVESAIANAENNHDLDVDALIVAEAYVGKSIVMKRFSARARGRASRIEKPFSRLTVIVRERGTEAKAAPKKAPAAKKDVKADAPKKEAAAKKAPAKKAAAKKAPATTDKE